MSRTSPGSSWRPRAWPCFISARRRCGDRKSPVVTASPDVPLLALGMLVFAFEVVFPVGFAWIATHRPAAAPDAVDLGRPYKQVTVPTADGLELKAWYVRSENQAAVITFPDREGTAEHSRMLAEAGYGVLALDMRGCGSSEGDPNAFGWGASEDIEAAVSFLGHRPDVHPHHIGALGLSVGGEQVLEAAAAGVGPSAVVSEGAGERSVRETLLFGPAAALTIPQQAVMTAAVAIFSGDEIAALAGFGVDQQQRARRDLGGDVVERGSRRRCLPRSACPPGR